MRTLWYVMSALAFMACTEPKTGRNGGDSDTVQTDDGSPNFGVPGGGNGGGDADTDADSDSDTDTDTDTDTDPSNACDAIDENGDGYIFWNEDGDNCGNGNIRWSVDDADCVSEGQSWADNGDDIDDGDPNVCTGDGDADTDADSDSDTDADTDADSDADTDSDTDTDTDVEPPGPDANCVAIDADGNGTIYWDADNDNYGNGNNSWDVEDADCTSPGQNWSDNGDDCDEGDPLVHNTCGGGGNDPACELIDVDNDGTIYWDADNDDCGNGGLGWDVDLADCSSPGQHWADNGDDMNDGDDNICLPGNGGPDPACELIDVDNDGTIYWDADNDNCGNGNAAWDVEDADCTSPGQQWADNGDDMNEGQYDPSECTGGGPVDHDLDNDTHDDVAYGGDDCDDLDEDIHPGVTEECDGVDQDCDGLNDELDECWTTVYRFKSPTSETRCFNFDSNQVPSWCEGYRYEREAFVIAKQQFDGNVPLYSCVAGEDEPYFLDQILPTSLSDVRTLESSGSECRNERVVGYVWLSGGPDYNPFDDECDVRRYVWDSGAGVGNGHIFTIHDDTTDMDLEDSSAFRVVTDHVCF